MAARGSHLVLLLALALVCVLGCVTQGVKRQDLDQWGLARVVVEQGTALAWPNVATSGDDVRVDPPAYLGAAVIVSSDTRVGARDRVAALITWLQRGARLPRERIFWLAGGAARPGLVRATIADAATRVGRRGSLLVVFIGEGESSSSAREERFLLDPTSGAEGGAPPWVTQRQVIDAILLGHRWIRSLVVWDACGPDEPADPNDPNEDWVGGIAPRSYAHLETDAGLSQKRARVTSVSAGLGSRCVDALPGGSGPAVSYLALAGLQGWADTDRDGEVDGDELGSFLQAWTQAFVTEADAVAAWERGDGDAGASAEYVAVRGSWHSNRAQVRPPSAHALIGRPIDGGLADGDAALTDLWAGGAVIRPPSIAARVRAQRGRSPILDRLIDDTERQAELPATLAERWCGLELDGLTTELGWECRRRRAFAHRFRAFLPVLDRDAAMLREVLNRAANAPARGRRRAERLLASFVRTYDAYREHPKVRAMIHAQATADPRERSRIASRGRMLAIGGGWFPRGCSMKDASSRCEVDEQPVRRVAISSFAIQEHEVSARDYGLCVAASGCPPIDAASCYRYDLDTGFQHGASRSGTSSGDRPATCVRWDQADAYCKWIGGRLPTESEWEKAARGEVERTFPWSEGTELVENMSCDRANVFECGERLLPTRAPLEGRSPYGVAHLAGNAAEWVADYYGRYRGRVDPKGPGRGRVRSVRGGSFTQAAADARTSYRYGLSPEFGYAFVGFRCAARQ